MALGSRPQSSVSDHTGRMVVLGVGTFVILLLLWIFSPFVVVGAGERGVLMNFGAVTGQPLQPGLHLIMPVRQSVHEMDVQVQKYSAKEAAASLDLQEVTTDVVVNWSLDPKTVNVAYRNIGPLYMIGQKVVGPAIDNAVKAVTARFNAEELISRRDAVTEGILKSLRGILASDGIFVTAVNVTNFAFSPAYATAIENKQVAQQEALQATYQLQQKKVNVQQTVVEAQAQAQARIEAAKGTAQAILLQARAQAKANDEIAASLTPILLRQKALDRWSGALPTYLGSGAPIPFLGSGMTVPAR
jgi:regulator of protease activity HflC (stomatin/prohibitin superfamily)